MDVVLEAAATYSLSFDVAVLAAALADVVFTGTVVVVVVAVVILFWHGRKRRVEGPASGKHFYQARVDLLDISSRGLTMTVDHAVKVKWIRSMSFWNREQHDVNSIIEFLGGVLWFRFHVRGDYGAMTTLPETMRCTDLLTWSLGPTSLKLNDHYGVVSDCIHALLALNIEVLPERVIHILLEQVLEECGRIQQFTRIRGSLYLLNILKHHEAFGMVQVGFVLPSTSRTRANKKFIERLASETIGDPIILASLPRIYTNLCLYGKAMNLLQDPITANAYLCANSMTNLLCSVTTWLDDCQNLIASMRHGLVPFPDEFLILSLTCLSQSLIEHHPKKLGNEEKEEMLLVDKADAFVTLATSLNQCRHAWQEALGCLTVTKDILEPLLTRCYFRIAESTWYLRILYVARGDKKTGLRCLSVTKDLTKDPGPQTLLEILRNVVQPCLLRFADSARLTESQGHKPAIDRGMEFSINQLRSQLGKTVHPSRCLSKTLNAISMQVDDQEAEFARRLSEISTLAEKLSFCSSIET